MQVIPVLDLMGGEIVHARRGERDAYRPIRSGLCAGSAPRDIAEALLALAPFRTLYIADLDSIRGRGDNDRVVRDLVAAFPNIAFWVDRGAASTAALIQQAAARFGSPVLGTEVMADARPLTEKACDFILSLDHDAAGPLGPRDIHENAALWPSRVIVMTLACVGAGAGPDLQRLSSIIAKSCNRRVFAAGGVSGPDDLERLDAAGAAGVLVASALHDGRLNSEALRKYR